MTCSAHTTRGTPCKGQAITGGKVCRVHGGSAPQVQAKARERILAAADPAAARLIAIALHRNSDPQDAIRACRDILNRAGIVAPRSAEDGPAGQNGQVLWEEFIQIHRRAVVSNGSPGAGGGEPE